MYYSLIGDHLSFTPAYQGLFLSIPIATQRASFLEQFLDSIGFIVDMTLDKILPTGSIICMRGIGLLPIPDSYYGIQKRTKLIISHCWYGCKVLVGI
jgi:hypothetical protein